ncbi:Ig-like domain-containing protein [Candidatus Solirubrobacter pratensis]|uniref:Ig-like domain-containing protein n=1 Tax=Candidatus Solirubrobacter pratensis TaxID=1298857 RepID=UPI0012DE6C71|nr:Ig-like domain-containing protein [Candidatus Solirubrobacter pratensis]
MRRLLTAIVAVLALAAPSTAAAAPPVVTFTAQPPALGTQTAFGFAFTADDAAATFTCALDSGAAAACVSPHPVSGLADGPHTFTVVATNAGMETGTVTSSFTVDTQPPGAPTVTVPANNALLGASPITFSGNASEAGTVTISEGATSVATATPAAAGPWSTAPVAVAEGVHTYAVTLTDAAGNVSAPTSLTVTVDLTAPAAPTIRFPVDGAAQRSTTVEFSGSTEANATVTVLDGGVAKSSKSADGAGNWTLTIANVSPGEHTYTSTATDAAKHVSAESARHVLTVAPNAPNPPVITGGPDGFSIVSDPGTTLDCRLDTPSGQGAFGPCPLSYPGLAPGDYMLVARATDAAGNASTAALPFTVGGGPPTQNPAPPPTVSASPMPPATPTAVASYGKTVVLRPSSGRTLIRRPRSPRFEELRAKTAVPVGTVVDTRKGIVVLTAAPATGTKTESAKFSGGVFTVTQSSGATQLALSEKLRCGRTRKLTGDGAGSFRIRGRYGDATGRGAKWIVQDSCKSTVVRVTRGVVAFRNLRAHKTVLVRAGRQATAQR